MLFVLDHDVSAAVGTVIRRAGHRCHTIASAGLALALDDYVSSFAADHNGVLLTHDKELIKRRKQNTFGYHVWLSCNEWEATEIVAAALDEVVAAVGTRDALCMKLTKEKLTLFPNRWI